MNKIIVLATRARGGIDSVVKTHEASGVFDGYKYTVIHTHDEGSIFKRLRQAIKSLLLVLVALFFNDVDVFHVHVSMKGSLVRKSIFIFLAKVFRKHVVFHLHGSEFRDYYDKAGYLYRFLARKTLDASDLVFVLSNSWKIYIETLTSSNVVVINNFVSPLFVGEPKDYPKVNKEFELLFLGYLGARKGIHDLLSALAILKKQGVSFRLNIGGNGDVSGVKARVAELGLADSVKMLGWVDLDLKRKYMSCCDVFVLPSYNEGLPMAILEAMSSKVVVLSTTVGGIPDLIESGVNGLLVEPGDVVGIANSLKMLSESVSLRFEMSNNAYETFYESFSPGVNVKKIRDCYDQLTDRDGC